MSVFSNVLCRVRRLLKVPESIAIESGSEASDEDEREREQLESLVDRLVSSPVSARSQVPGILEGKGEGWPGAFESSKPSPLDSSLPKRESFFLPSLPHGATAPVLRRLDTPILGDAPPSLRRQNSIGILGAGPVRSSSKPGLLGALPSRCISTPHLGQLPAPQRQNSCPQDLGDALQRWRLEQKANSVAPQRMHSQEGLLPEPVSSRFASLAPARPDTAPGRLARSMTLPVPRPGPDVTEQIAAEVSRISLALAKKLESVDEMDGDAPPPLGAITRAVTVPSHRLEPDGRLALPPPPGIPRPLYLRSTTQSSLDDDVERHLSGGSQPSPRALIADALTRQQSAEEFLSGKQVQVQWRGVMHVASWRVPVKRLRDSPEIVQLSPLFHLYGQPFKLILRPWFDSTKGHIERKGRGRQSFKAAKGRFTMELKCVDNGPYLRTSFFAGRGTPLGPVIQDFSQQNVASLPTQESHFDLDTMGNGESPYVNVGVGISKESASEAASEKSVEKEERL